jgi:hypothetical protein
LRRLYLDEALPPTARIRAAPAIGHESAPLKAVEPAVDAACEEIIPLPQLIAERRARADAIEREMRDIEVSPSGTVRVLPKPGSNGGNGQDDDTAG